MDLLQCAMQGKGWGHSSRQRPWKELWPQGWKAVLAVIEILKPGKLLFVGSGVATNCRRKLLPGGVDAKINNHRKVGLGQTLQDGLGDGFREAARTVF